MSKDKKRYTQFSILLDPNDPEEKEILDWMMANRTKKVKYVDMLREAMKEYIAKRKQP